VSYSVLRRVYLSYSAGARRSYYGSDLPVFSDVGQWSIGVGERHRESGVGATVCGSVALTSR